MAGKIRILIVEDDEGIALHLEFILKRMGYSPIESVNTGEKAIQRAGALRPSLVLMDIFLMSRMTGIEAAKEINEQYKIPVIFMTGMSGDEILKDARLSNPYAYLVKPVDEKELRAAIELTLYKHQMEQRLGESEERYRLLFERIEGGFALLEILLDDLQRPSGYRFLAVNPSFERITGYKAEDVLTKTMKECMPQFEGLLIHHMRLVAETGVPEQFQLYEPEAKRYDDVKVFLSKPGQIAILLWDITERVVSEKTLEENELRFRQLAEGVSEVFWLQAKDNREFLYANPSYERVWGRPREELYANPAAFFNAVYSEDVQRVSQAYQAHQRTETMFDEEYRIIRPDGTIRWVWTQINPVYDKSGEVVRFSGFSEDVTERKQSEQKLIESVHLAEKRYLRMSVLRNIDQVITTQTDLETIVQSVLASIARLAEVSATLLFRPIKLSEGSGVDFTLDGSVRIDSKKIRPPAMDWMKQQAQEIYQTLQPVFINRLDSQADLGTVQLILDFGFEGFAALPLVAKGQVKGILVLMLRFKDCMDEDVTHYFESVALQVAIAIDSVELFQSLKFSNAQLTLAYDATIRGWAQALELRDKETRGHSERVVLLAARLARELGVTEEELVHFQRGVLLHDIGKMAIPDNVLLKPGPLTEDEWVLMRQHPVYAFEMLSQIEYLKPALDVPYCHHEKWDGTGYPRGLKGNKSLVLHGFSRLLMPGMRLRQVARTIRRGRDRMRWITL